MEGRELAKESDQRAFAEGIGDRSMECERWIVLREIADPGGLQFWSAELWTVLALNTHVEGTGCMEHY